MNNLYQEYCNFCMSNAINPIFIDDFINNIGQDDYDSYREYVEMCNEIRIDIKSILNFNNLDYDNHHIKEFDNWPYKYGMDNDLFYKVAEDLLKKSKF